MGEKIADSPQYKQLADQMLALGCLSTFLPCLLSKEQRREFKRMRMELEELRRLPDQFNELFLNRGWVCYDSMNGELIKRCVKLGQAGDLDGAEQEMVNYYQEDIRYLVLPLVSTGSCCLRRTVSQRFPRRPCATTWLRFWLRSYARFCFMKS